MHSPLAAELTRKPRSAVQRTGEPAEGPVGELRTVVVPQEPGRFAEGAWGLLRLRGVAPVVPVEPPDPPVPATAPDHPERVGQQLPLALRALVEAERGVAGPARRRAPPELGDPETRVPVAAVLHRGPGEPKLAAKLVDVGRVRVERDDVEVPLDPADLVEPP